MAFTFFKQNKRYYTILFIATAFATFIVLALLLNITQRQQEAKKYPFKVVEIGEHEIDPAIWGKNFPHQYDTFIKTETDYGKTEFGGSTPYSKLERVKSSWRRS